MTKHITWTGYFLGLCLLLTAGVPAVAQELNCRVTIDISSLAGSEFNHLSELKDQIERYLNDRTWTNDSYRQEERIDCSMQITFRDVSRGGVDVYTAQISVGSQRPIFGTPATTNVFQIVDTSWQFPYERNSSLIFDPERFNALTSVVDYYAYMVLGYDYDTFFELGGTPYFQRARRITELAQAEGGAGWSQVDNRGRAVLVTQLLDPRLEPVRKGYFAYHYGCLDHFIADTRKARQSGIQVLKAMEGVYNDISNQYVMDLFFSTKNQELVSVFDDSDLSAQAYGVLLNVDPSRSSIYDELIR